MTSSRVLRATLVLSCILAVASIAQAAADSELADVTLYTTNGLTRIPTGTSLIFNATSADSEESMYEFIFGDNFLVSRCSGAFEYVAVTHTFSTVGEYDVDVLVHNNVSEINTTMTIIVMNPVTATLVITVVDDTLYQQETLELNITVEAGTQPTVAGNVFCSIDFGGDEFQVIYIGDFSEDTNLTVTNSNYTKFVNFGAHDINVTCWNPLSGVCEIATVEVYKHITDLKIYPNDTDNYYYPTGSTVGFTVVAQNGELGAMYEVDFGDGAIDILCQDTHENFTVSHTYKVSGSYIVYASARDDVVWLETEASMPVVIQHGVKGLELNATPTDVTYPNSTVDYVLAFTDERYFATPGENVTCVWSFGDSGKEQSDSLGNLVPGFVQEETFFHQMSGSLNQTTTVNCSNLVSYQLMSEIITVRGPFSNLTISVVGDRMIPTNSTAHYSIKAVGGDSELMYIVDFDDGDIVLKCSPNHMDFIASHGHRRPGVYWAFVMADDENVVEEDSLDVPVIVQNPLLEIEVDADTLGQIPDGSTVFEITSTAPDPTNVTCTWNYPGDTMEDVDVVFENGLANHTKLFGQEALGEVEISVNCSNLVSNASASVTVTYFAGLQDLTITAQKYGLAIGETTNLFINMSAGNNVTYEVDYGNLSSASFPVDMDLALAVPVSYSDRGFFNVSVRAYNVREELTAYSSHLIKVYTEIRDFTLVVEESPRPMPPGEVNFTVTPHVDYIPLEQLMTWDFADGNAGLTAEADIVFDQVTPLPHTMAHTYTLDDNIGNNTVTLNISNPVSYQFLEAEVVLVEIVGDLTVTADKFYAGVGEDVTFTVRVARGSHLTFIVSYGDDIIDGVFRCDDSRGDFMNRELQFVHAYDAPGDYFVSATASNIFNDVEITMDKPVHVQYAVYDLSLSSNTPVLTPPGNILYTLDTSPDPIPAPTNVTCTWVYGDGNDDVENHDNMTLPQSNVTHVYRPTLATFKSVLNTVVTCWNNVSSDNASTSVVIEPNNVTLGKITTNDPKAKVHETLDITLSIINYGYDPCIVFYITGPHAKTVLFGRDECKTLKPVYDEYYLQGETSTIVYSNEFPTWGIYNVRVTAENGMSSDEVSAKFFILPRMCKRPYVSVGREGLDPESPRLCPKAQPFSAHGVITVDCDLDYRLYHEWKIERNVSGVMTLTDLRLFKTYDLNIDANSLPVGDYRFTLIGTLDVFLVYINEHIVVDNIQSMFVKILPSPLEVRIYGGDEVVKQTSRDVTLRALPVDPDEPGDVSGMTLKWSCKVTPEPTYAASPDWDSISDFGLDSGDCFPGRSPWDAYNTTLEIPWATLNSPSTNYSFTVRVEKDDRAAEHTQWVTFSPNGPLDLDLRCHGPNCKSLINHASIFMMRGECLNCRQDDNIVYTWEVFKETALDSNDFEPFPLHPSSFTDRAVLHTKADFRPNSLRPGLWYKIRVSATTSDGLRFGSSADRFLINEPPYGGQCHALRKIERGSLLDNYQVICQDWKDDTMQASHHTRTKRAAFEESSYLPLNYEMMSAGKLLFFGREPQSTVMPLQPLDEDNNTLPIVVIVRDEFGSPADDGTSIEAQARTNRSDSPVDLAKEVKDFADRGDIQGTVQASTALLIMESQGNYPPMIPVSPENLTLLYGGPGSEEANITGKDDEFFDNFEIPFHGFLIDQVAKLDPSFPRQVEIEAKLMKEITSDYRYFMEDSPIKATDIMDELSEALTEQAVYTDPSLVDRVALDITYTLGNIVDHVATVGRDQYDDCTDACDRPELKEDLKYEVEKGVEIFAEAADLLVANKLPGEDFIKQEEEKFTMIAGKKRAQDIAGMVTSGIRGGIYFPKYSPYLKDVEPTDCVQFLYLAFENNPYIWHPSAADINSPTQQVTAKDCYTGEPLEFIDVPNEDPYRVHVNVTSEKPNMTLTVVNDTNQLALHNFETFNPSDYVQLFFDPWLDDMTFELFLAYERTPTATDYDYNASLPLVPPESENFTTPFSILLPQNQTSRLGNYTVGVWVKVGGAPITNPTNYTFYVQYIKSRLYTFEDEIWAPRGSQVEPDTTPEEVRFTSTVFADSLGAGLFVGPNTIDFSTVFDNLADKIIENMHVLVTVILMIVVFVVMTPVARHMDMADIAMVTPAPIFPPNVNMSNNELYPYQYQLDVSTGLGRGSGTDSKVYVTIVGVKADTGIMALESSNRKNFKRGDTNSFLMRTPGPLGKLTYLRLFHDNSGAGDKASWFCEKVIVTEKHSRKKYLFLVNGWLAVGKGDGKVDRVTPVATREELLSFKSLFPRRSKKYLTNDHMWISVFYKESGEKFTRVQRLGCAMAAIFMTMIADAMWYQRDESEGKKEGFNIGPFAFTLQALWVSVCSVLTVIPVTFIIVFLFKRSTIKMSSAEKKAQQLEEEFFAELDAGEKEGSKAGDQGEKAGGGGNMGEDTNNKTPDNNDDAAAAAGEESDTEEINISINKGNKTGAVNTNHSNNNVDDDANTNNCNYDVDDDANTNNSNSNTVDDDDDDDDDDANINNNNNTGADDNANDDPASENPKRQGLTQADEEFLENRRKEKKKKGDGRFLPYWCRYIAWVLIFTVIVLSAFFTILYSFEWGGDKSSGWLTAFLLSFTESEFMISPVKAIVLAVIFSLFCKKLLDDDVEDGEDEYANAVCRDDDENGPAPPTRRQVRKARRKYHLERQLMDALRTLVYHAVFLVSLILVTYSNRDTETFRQNETMRNHFIRNIPFGLINSEGSFYDWMEQIVIPRLYMTEYNNWDPVVKNKDLRYTEDSMCYRLGPAQIRQYRVKPDHCKAALNNLNVTCNVDYSRSNEDEGDYALGWERLTGNDTIDVLDGAYVYRHDQDSVTTYWGWLAKYFGGGYIANLGTTKEMAFKNLDKLKEYRWFDRYTRALIFELNAYNANSNLFTMVSVMLEFPSYGAAVPRQEIWTVKMYRYFGPWGVFALATEIILILAIIFLFVKLIYNVSKQGCCRYLREFWHKIEVAKVTFTMLALGFYIQRTVFIKSTVEDMMNNRGQVVSFMDVVLVDDIFINMIGAALFMQILQLLWVLQFNKSLAELSTTITHSWDYLKSYFISLSVIFTAFATVAYNIYGTMLWNYRDFLHTIYAQLISILGKFDTNEIVVVGGEFGRIFFMGYQLILLFIFINLLIAILNDTIADINSGAVYVRCQDEVFDLLIEKLGWGRKKKKKVKIDDGDAYQNLGNEKTVP